MNDAADCSALVLSHRRKVRAAADALAEVRSLLLTVVAEEVDSVPALVRAVRGTDPSSDDVLRDALRLTTTAERLITEARAILSECGPLAA
jgi:septum formation topological specificity factor MinE